MHVASRNGQADYSILPDTGAEICAAGLDFMIAVGEHVNNLMDSNLAVRAVNCTTMRPLGMIRNVKFAYMNQGMHGRRPHLQIRPDSSHLLDQVQGAWNLT